LILLDLRCDDCGREEKDAEIRGGIFPICCAQPMRWVPFVPKTDVLGAPAFSIALGREVTSTRERDRIAKANGFVPCGDPVGGSRNEDHRNLGKATAYSGQRVRRTLVKERS
jgi:hypothetical protein